MDDKNLTQEDLDKISELQAKLDEEKTYTPRPRSQRVLAWVLVALMVVGIILFCYWQMTPLV